MELRTPLLQKKQLALIEAAARIEASIRENSGILADRILDNIDPKEAAAASEGDESE